MVSEHPPRVPADGEADPAVGEGLPSRSPAPVATAVLIAVLAATLGITQMSRYGVTTDSPSLFYAGDRTLFWILNPDVPGALDFRGPDPPGFETSFERHPEWKDPLHVPVLAGLLAAVTSKVFHETLGWVDVVDGHHLALVLLHSLALLLFCLYASRLLGSVAGISATVILALFPPLSAIPSTTPRTGRASSSTAWPFSRQGSASWRLGRATFWPRRSSWAWRSAESSTASSFSPPSSSGRPVAFLLLYRGRRAVPGRVVGAYLVAPYIAGVVFFALWPWLYYGRIPDWWRHIHWYMVFLLDYGVGQRSSWTAHPFECLAFMTPPIVLVLALVYALRGWTRSRENAAVHSLLLVWLLVPLVRIAAPHSHFYDANRHFLEYVPALCAMAGGGAALALSWLRKRWSNPRSRWALRGAVGLVCAALVWPVIRYHPYETAYFNAFVGGLGGAQRRALFLSGPSSVRLNGTEGDYWYSSLRAGLRDIESSFPREGPSDSAAHVRPWVERTCGQAPPCASSTERRPPSWPISSTHRRDPGCVVGTTCATWRSHGRPSGVWSRGGGLIYEVFGPADGQARLPTTGPTAYDAVPGPEFDDRGSAVAARG